jgi:hypothetical protein
MSSLAQINANRENAKLSTGPKSAEGKAKVVLNAVKTGLTGRTVLLSTDDVAAYEAHVARCVKEYAPVTDREKELTQSIADTQWRLDRIATLEHGIYAMGRLEFAELFEDQPAAVRKGLIETRVFLTYQRQLNNLGIQEARLRRQYTKDTEELKATITERHRARRAALSNAAVLYESARKYNQTFDPAEFGFDFATADVIDYIASKNKETRIANRTYYAEKSTK